MSNAIADAITSLQNELEVIDEQRDKLQSALDGLRTLSTDYGSMTPKSAVRKRTDGRTDGPRQRPARSLPSKGDFTTKHGAAVVDALRKKSPQSPTELAASIRLERSALGYHLKPLVAAGAIVALGSTNNRQYTLPGKSHTSTKEEP